MAVVGEVGVVGETRGRSALGGGSDCLSGTHMCVCVLKLLGPVAPALSALVTPRALL